MAASKRFVEKVWKGFLENKGHDFNCYPALKIISSKPGIVRAEMTVDAHQVNRMQSLHGGVTSSLVDSMGSLALSSRGLYMTGVSIDIHVTFVKAAMAGEVIAMKAEVVGIGKTLAFTRVEIESVKTGKLLAYGSHTKYVATALKGDQNVTFTEDGETQLTGAEC